jgi:hypothetical protein
MRQFHVHVIVPANKAHVTAKFDDLDAATLFFQQTAIQFVTYFPEGQHADWVNDDLVHFKDDTGHITATIRLEFAHTGGSHAARSLAH